MRTLIVYHREDNDGLFSAAIAYKAEVEQGGINNECSLQGADYNNVDKFLNNPEYFEYDRFVLVDFSFPVWMMARLADRYKECFVWCDHHKPIIDKIEKEHIQIAGIRDTEHSAIYNTFKFYYPERRLPDILDILQKYDSWTYTEDEKDYVTAVNSAVTTNTRLDIGKVRLLYNEILEAESLRSRYPNIVRDLADKLYEQGKIIEDYKRQENDYTVKNFGDLSFFVDNRPACLVVTSARSNSMMFDSLRGSSCKHGIVMKRTDTGNWVCSVYNIDENTDFHAGEYLAKHYNGGGHKGAAGCTLSQEQFDRIIKAHVL